MSISDKLVAIAENEQKVYDAGKKAQYDLFWDRIQNNGKATNYAHRFYGWQFGWEAVDSLFIPKYDFIHAGSPLNTFRECYVYDMLKDNYFNQTTSALSLNYTFYYATRLYNARTLYVREDTQYTSPFTGCSNLVEICFSGTIGQNGLAFAQSTKLSKASIESVINALSPTTSGLTVTFSKTAVNKAFETSSGANDGSTSSAWTTLRNSKSNWTISLA